jgi:hypothetical protein
VNALRSGFQFTIGQQMTVTAILGLILALTKSALHGNEWMIMTLALVWFTAPLWGWIGLGLLSPSVSRGWLLASCVVVLPISGYHFYRYMTLDGPFAIEWLAWCLAFLWLIVPFGIGHAVSRNFHAWRARNRVRGDGQRDPVMASAR